MGKPSSLYEQLRDECEGFDDPEERCPRHPKDCLCWRARTVNEQPGRRALEEGK